jgi:hypothetical protein
MSRRQGTGNREQLSVVSEGGVQLPAFSSQLSAFSICTNFCTTKKVTCPGATVGGENNAQEATVRQVQAKEYEISRTTTTVLGRIGEDQQVTRCAECTKMAGKSHFLAPFCGL